MQKSVFINALFGVALILTSCSSPTTSTETSKNSGTQDQNTIEKRIIVNVQILMLML